MEGTNCEEEAYLSFQRSGAAPEYVHIVELEKQTKKLLDYDIIFVPGGFSAGDYVRAGAIFAARLFSAANRDLIKLSEERKPIVGVCNGFQVLAELGLLPGGGKKNIAVTYNSSGRFECRKVFVRSASENRMIGKAFARKNAWEIPVAHSEGRVIIEGGEDGVNLLEKSNQILFRYVDPKGELAGYPWNPNGSAGNIAGISNEYGNVIGLMPHPERIYYDFSLSTPTEGMTAGKAFFDSIVEYSRTV